MSIQYVTFGIIIDDLIFPNGKSHMGLLGGGGAQTAWGMAAALGSGESVGLVAGIGDDIDPRTLDPLRNAGINLFGVRTTPLATPRAWQIIEHDGQREQKWRSPTSELGSQLARDWSVLPKHYQQASNFHWGIHVEDGAPEFARYLRSIGKRVSLEAFRPVAQPLSHYDKIDLFRACNIFSATDDEFTSMTTYSDVDSIASSFGHFGGKYLTIRQGMDGATVLAKDEALRLYAPAIETFAIDPLGAGNAFCGAFLARLDDGVHIALAHGIVAASFMIEQVGMPNTLPDTATYTERLDETLNKIVTTEFKI